MILVANKRDDAVENESAQLPSWLTMASAGRCPGFPFIIAANAAYQNATSCHLYRMPNELLFLISGHLDLISAIALCFASKRFFDSRLWEHVCGDLSEGLALAKELGLDFIETSAKTGVNVRRAFYDLVCKIDGSHAAQEQLHSAILRREKAVHRPRGAIRNMKRAVFLRDACQRCQIL